jgi:uncharacterized protein with HEPN domain
MNRRAAKSLFDASIACEEIEELIGTPSFPAYQSDRRQQLVAERLLHVIGESVHHATSSFPPLLEVIPDAAEIVGKRNVIAHGYTELQQERLWNALVHHVPELCSVI